MKKFRGNVKRSAVALLATSLAVVGLQLVQATVGTVSPAKAEIVAAGNSDDSFNGGGFFNTDNEAPANSTLAGIAVDRHNRIITLFQQNAPGGSLTSIALSRTSTDGQSDVGFGTVDGEISIDLKTSNPNLTRVLPRDLYIDPANDDIYVLSQVADTFNGPKAFNVTRLNHNGGLIWSINRNFTGASGNGQAYAIASTGFNIYVAGAEEATAAPNREKATIQVFAPDLSPTGVFSTFDPGPTNSSVWRDMKIDASNRLVLTGSATDTATSDLNDVIIHRYTTQVTPAAVTPDASFATGNSSHRYDFNVSNGETGTAIAIAPDNRVAVAVTGTTASSKTAGVVHLSASGGVVGGWNGGNSMLAFDATKREASGIAFDKDDQTRILVSGRENDQFSYISRLAANGGFDATYSGSGTASFQFAGRTVSVPPMMIVDSANRPVTALGYADLQLGMRRWTSGHAAPLEAPGKILFDDKWGSAAATARVPVGMSLSGNEIVPLNNISNSQQTMEQPAADQGGRMFTSFKISLSTNGGQPYIVAGGADGAGGQIVGVPPGGFGTTKMSRPTLSNVSDEIAYLLGEPGTACVKVVSLPVGSGFTAPVDPVGGSLCNVTDAALNPSVAGGAQIAYVRSGQVWATFGDAPDVLMYDGSDGPASRVEWGENGDTLVWNQGASELGVSLLPFGAFFGPPTFTASAWMPVALGGGMNVTGFAFDPDGGATFPIYFSSGDTIYKKQLTGTPAVAVFSGIAPRVSQWQRNFSIYSPQGDVYDAGTPSIPTNQVDLQSKAPSAAEKGIETSGLLKLNLLKSPLFKLNLLKSGLLKLNLLKSGLLKLNLLKSGLLKLNLLKSPLVEKGLKQTTLSSLPISESALASGGGWIDRIKAMNTPEALDLAKLPLTEITLADVVALGDTFNMPGLGEVDLSHSLFGTVSVMPFLLGNTPVGNINGIDWCEVFEERGFANCGEVFSAVNPTTGAPLGDGRTASLLSLQIAGFNLDNLPKTRTNDTHDNDLRAVHWEDVTFDSEAVLPKFVLYSTETNLETAVNTHNTSLGSALVRNVPNAQNLLWCVGATGVPAGTTPIDCSTGTTNTTNLDQAMINKAIRENRADGDHTAVIVGDLGAALNGISVNELALGLWGEPGDDPYDQPPSALGINASSGLNKTFVISYSRLATGAGTIQAPRAIVTLPAGITYTPDSTRFINSNVSQNEIDFADPAISNGGTTLEFTFPQNFDGANGGFIQWLFDTSASAATPVTGQAIVQWDDGYLSQVVDSADFSSSDSSETGDDTLDATNLSPDRLYFGRLADSKDVDYYAIPTTGVPEGSTLTVYLSQLKYDADLVVYHSDNTDLAEAPMRAPSKDPAVQNGGTDPGQKIYNAGEPLVVEGENDVPLLPGQPVAAVSNHRGNRGERAEAITWGTDAPYIVQVSGFAGASGTDTYAVRYSITPPPTPPASQARTGFTNAPVSAGTLSPGAPVDTVILTNMGRMERLYAGSSAALAPKVQALRAATNGVVIPVDGLSAYTAWDANPQDPDLANAVVTQINDRVDTFLGSRRGEVKSIILVGTDEVLPMARVPDLTQTGNERTFAQDLRETAAGDKNNALLGAALSGRILSDDPYGAFKPRAFGGTWLYVPDVALGRLVETPGQITKTIDEFLAPQDANTPAGMIRPTATLSAGYDFMRTLTQTVSTAFAAQLPGLGANNVSMVDTWTSNSILNAVNNGGSAPTLISLNAHYSPWAFSPALGKSNVSANQFASAADLRRRLLFTMGCHSGFNVTNYLQTGSEMDFAEATADEPVGAFIGNTGYGIGINNVNAFSQKLFGDYAYFISQNTLGGALQQAKQEYLANGITNPYDYKVVAQAVFYGIPNYKIVGATPVTPPPSPPLPWNSPGNGGMKTSSLKSSAPTDGSANDKWSLQTDAATGNQQYVLAGGNTNISVNRPTQPTMIRDVTVPGEVAGSAFITSLKIAGDTANFNPTLATPVIDSTVSQPEAQFGDLVFPGNPLKLTSFNGPDGPRQRVVATMAQFTSTGLNANGEVVGTERRFNEIGYDVIYRPAGATDITPPVMLDPSAIANGSTTQFRVTVTDAESDIVRVAVLYRPESGNTFQLLNLSRESYDPATHSAVYTGTANVSGHIDYAIEALNSQALGGFTSAKGRFYDEVPRPAGTKSISTSYSRPFDDGSTFFSTSPTGAPTPVSVFFTENPSGGVATYKVNGGASQPYNTTNGVVLSSPGTYHLEPFASDGTTGPIDVVVAARPAEVVSITYDRQPDVAGLYTSAVTATVSSADPASTIKLKVDAETSYTTKPNNAVTFSTDGNHTIRYQTSRGTTNDTTPVTVKVDLNAPTVNFAQPSSEGQTYTVGQVVNASYTCSDTNPDTCIGTPANGAALNTSTATGFNQFRDVTVTATDKAGRTTTAVRHYRVVPATETLTATIDGAPISSGIYTAAKTVVVKSSSFSAVSATVDSVPVTTTANGDGSYSFPVSTDGDHQVTYFTSGANGSAAVKIDLNNPVVNSVTTPVEGATYAQNQAVTAVFTCTDTHLTSCLANGQASGAATVPTNTVGAKTFTITATDAAGKSTNRVVNYTVVADTFTVLVNGAAPNSNWYTETPAPGPKVTVKSALNRPIEIWLDSGTHTTFAAGATAELTVTVQGTHTVSWKTPEVTGSPVVVKVDLAAPVAAITSPVAGTPTYLTGTSQTAAFTCTDTQSVASCVGTVENLTTHAVTTVTNGGALPTNAAGDFQVKVVATDVAGRTHEATRNYKVATDGVSADKASGTYLTATTVNFTSVLGSAISVTVAKTNAPTSTNTYNFAAGAPASVTLTEGDYHVTYSTSTGATGTPLDFVIDEAAPTIIATTPAADTPNYLRNQVVNANYTCADTHLTGCTAPVASGSPIDTSSFGAKTFDITATDSAGRSVTVHRPYNVVDQLSVSVTGPQSGTFYVGATTLHVASLGGSPVFVTVNGVETGYPTGTADVVFSIEDTYNISYRTDVVGGPSGILQIKLDLTGPKINFTNPSTGTPSYIFGQNINALYNCTDVVAGIASCNGSQASGTPLNTNSVTGAGQTRSVSVTATDNAGKTTTDSRNYTVKFADGTPCESSISHRLNGINGPVVVPNSGQVITLLFRLCDANGVAIGNDRYGVNTIPSPVESNGSGVKGYCGPVLNIVPICLLPPLLSPRDNSFTYQPSHEWRFRHDTSGLSVGDHTFFINLLDGTKISYVVRVQP